MPLLLILFFSSILAAVFSAGCGPSELSPSEIRHHAALETRDSLQRKADVYLPPGYHSSPRKRYPVIYMLDGQNLFHADSSMYGLSWEIDSLLDTLVLARETEPVIVVGVWSTQRRILEYMPDKGLAAFPDSAKQRFLQAYKEPESNYFLQILVEDIKPFIDSEYRTMPDAAHTFISGAAQGGLTAFYAISEHPEVFGAAACISTHWPISPRDMFPEAARALVDALGANLPDPATHRIYFDYGTEGYDALYEPYQMQMDAHMKARGYEKGKNWETLKFEGAGGYPPDWRARFHTPLAFLLSGAGK